MLGVGDRVLQRRGGTIGARLSLINEPVDSDPPIITSFGVAGKGEWLIVIGWGCRTGMGGGTGYAEGLLIITWLLLLLLLLLWLEWLGRQGWGRPLGTPWPLTRGWLGCDDKLLLLVGWRRLWGWWWRDWALAGCEDPPPPDPVYACTSESAEEDDEGPITTPPPFDIEGKDPSRGSKLSRGLRGLKLWGVSISTEPESTLEPLEPRESRRSGSRREPLCTPPPPGYWRGRAHKQTAQVSKQVHK